MPQTITIGSFVLGAVLLLIGILGGRFKIFGAEVSGQTGVGPRAIAGILGMLFLGGGVFGSFIATQKETLQQPPINTGGANGTVNRADVVSRQEPPPKQEPLPKQEPAGLIIAGRWRDELGSIYSVTQTGNTFTFQAYNPGSGLRSQGNGTITGRRVMSAYQVDTPGGLPVNGNGCFSE